MSKNKEDHEDEEGPRNNEAANANTDDNFDILEMVREVSTGEYQEKLRAKLGNDAPESNTACPATKSTAGGGEKRRRARVEESPSSGIKRGGRQEARR